MNIRILPIVLSALLVLGAVRVHAQDVLPQADDMTQAAIGTAFTYQGQLKDGGQPANGAYDLRFILYTAAQGGSQVGPIVTKADVAIEKGLFTVLLDFGNVFNNTALFLEAAVRPGASAGNFLPLTPRQPLTPAPLARYAVAAGNASIAKALTLPYSATIDSDLAALNLTNLGLGSAVALDGKTNQGATLLVRNTGGGNAIQGLLPQGPGGFTAVAGYVNGNEGMAGNFQITNANNDYNALYVRTLGIGSAASLNIQNASNDDIALRVSTDGLGSAAEFRNSNDINSMPTLWAINSGNGSAAQFHINDPNNAKATIYADTKGTDSVGYFESKNPTNTKAALYAKTIGTGAAASFEVLVNTAADALYARTTSGSASSYAGYFSGKVHVNGALSKSAGSFKIDHPLDPANKYLQHSFVESPDMLNIYNGNVTLDAQGEAIVALPNWFEALNMDFRYQLTALGAPGPTLYIAQEVQNNQFKIAGGAPGGRVSWQVTGVRHDAYANAHRIAVESVKPPEERGTYLNPVEHGQPASLGLDAMQHSSAPAAQQAVQP